MSSSLAGNNRLASALRGLTIDRVYTTAGVDPFDTVKWTKRKAEIKSENGKSVFVMEGVEAPETWSQRAVDIAADKYFRKVGVPGTGHEKSVRQMIARVVLAIRKAGERVGGYFATPEDAQAFSDELTYVLLHQIGAFNSPVWFNCGLFEAYGISGKPSGNFVWDFESETTAEAKDSYSRPATSACFILSIEDDLMDIARHVEREMRVFRFGGGAGGNFSALRAEGEPLSNGGTSSGLMSWLEIFDKAAGATKSGGATRRAAKLIRLDVDHPDIESFVQWKAREEDKALALIRAGYPSDFNGEVYRTVSGQQANNSVGVSDEFMQAVVNDGDWSTRFRTSGKVAATFKARKLFRQISEAAHRCADPGLQFDTTINKWHTCPQTGRIMSSNPCSEFLFLQNTSCNLASINLVKFLKTGGYVDLEKLQHTCRIFTVAQEILVDHASYPTEAIARNSHDYRPLGLGYANLGTLLMLTGHAYDSDHGRSIAAALTAIVTATGYATSAEMAKSKGPFPGFAHNRDDMLRVMRQHANAAKQLDVTCPSYMRDLAVFEWERVVTLGDRHGYRNAQATVIAPAGTIGFLMDCDTTGVEPDFALVKHKKLAGGGYMKILNGSISRALEALGYDEPTRKAILDYVEKHETIEGAPGFQDHHLPVFDCANRCGPTGKRFIRPMGHVEMLAAVQPFVSGSISKTVNCPNETTVEEIEQLYLEAWKRGLKCIAIYRDGSKHAQPLSTKETKKEEPKAQAPAGGGVTGSRESVTTQIIAALQEAKKPVEHHGAPKPAVRTAEAPPASVRHRLPYRRAGGFTHELVVGGTKVYLRTGEYGDGSVGEIFVDLAKEGGALKALLNCFSIAVSLGLQHGVPIQEYVDAFTFLKFDPAGPVKGHPNVKMATSVIDAIFRVLAVEYMGEAGLEFAQVKTPAAKPGDEKLLSLLRKIAAKGEPVDGDPLDALKKSLDLVREIGGHPEPEAFAPVLKPTNGNGGNGHADMTPKASGQFCSRCGSVMQRSGTCYACNSCGATTGCS